MPKRYQLPVRSKYSKLIFITQGGNFMHKNLLQQYFPMIRQRMEVETIIQNNPKLNSTFMGWTMEQQNEFLDFCTGERGVKILYDSFFKEVFNAVFLVIVPDWPMRPHF